SPIILHSQSSLLSSRILLINALPSSPPSINILTFNEQPSPNSQFQILERKSYGDGTILLRIAEKDMQKNCLAPLITLRLIHLNGTITPISINYPKLDTIQGNNPCINYINNQVGYRKPLSKRDPATTSQDNITKSKNEESSPTSKSEDISAPTFVDTSAPVDTLSVEKPTSSLTTSASISSTVTVSEGEVPLIESTDLFANIAPITETSKKRSSLTTSTSTSIEPT
ncbi:6525_t:CDS:1, partial [Entrophospora sp. SA101]